jgi:hypothetical protein
MVFAVAAIGSAYSLWFEDVQLNTTASTVSLDGGIFCSPLGDNEVAGWPPSFGGPFYAAYPNPAILKDVGQASIVVPQANQHHAEITVTNAYPGYAVDCQVHVINTAPVPWHIENMQFTVQQCNSAGANCTPLIPGPSAWTTTCQVGGNCSWGNLGINPPNYPLGLDTWSPVYAAVEDREGCQVHQYNSVAGSVMLGINQSALENVQYKISLDYTVNQWNESQWQGCGQLRPTPTTQPGN